MSVYSPTFDSMRDLFLSLAQLRRVDKILELLTRSLTERTHVPFAGVWLLENLDPLDKVPTTPEASERLRLFSTHDRTRQGSSLIAQRVRELFTEVSVTEPLIGRAAIERRHLRHIENKGWEKPAWAEEANIFSVGSTPIIYQDRVLGVLSVFIDRQITESAHEQGAEWQRILSDHVAALIVNARAFEEIERLRDQLELENAYLREEVMEARKYGSIVGESRALKRVLEQVSLVAPTEANVLLLGESGTGKDLVAQQIHQKSKRKEGPFIRVNCAAIPSELFESEFFGHVKGSFTGAISDREGRFQLANGGTLFLDEISEIPIHLQSKLLGVLQEGTIERVGEGKSRKVDVRVIAASNRNLAQAVAEDRFREDLYFRLSVFPIEIPPLRERLEDIPALARHLIDVSCQRLRKPLVPITQGDIMKLQDYSWPGNVRELQNVIERAVIISKGRKLCLDFLDTHAAPAQHPAETKTLEVGLLTDEKLRELQKNNLVQALENANWRIQGRGGAAERLGIHPTTLRSRMKVYGISRPAKLTG